MAPSAGAIAYIYHHVVLPPKLPQEDDHDPAHERELIELVKHALLDLKNNVVAKQQATVQSAIATIENLLHGRDVFGHISAVALESLLSQCARGNLEGMIPLEVKEQNAGVLVSRCTDGVVFDFFELSPTNASAMQAGRLIRSFPGYASRISKDKLAEPTFCKTLASTIATMTTQAAPNVRPQVRKNNVKETESRDTNVPVLITEFVMSFVTAHGQTTEVEHISKHTREDVLWSNCLHPWRRSPLWLLLRVTLQLFFTRKHALTLTKNDGDLYKVFMVFMLTRVLDLVMNSSNDLDSEIVHITSAKLHRRLRKLELSKQTSSLRPEWADKITNNIISAHSVIEKSWLDLTAEPHANIDTAILKRLRPEDDLDMTLPVLDAFLSEAAGRKRAVATAEFTPSSTYPQFEASQLPNASFGTGDHKIYCLAALEVWVQKHLHTWTQQHIQDTESCGKLRQLTEAYHSNACVVYAEKPISMSVMYLTILELWVACDTSACSIHPLLLEFDPELDLVELQCLTLPLKSHLERLHGVEVHVSSRRTAAKKSQPSLYRNFGNPSSFAVRYFDGDDQQQATLARIESEATQKRNEKRQELAKLKTQYKSLMDAYNTGVCENETYVYNRRFGYTSTRHARYCSRCARKTKADGLNIQIYEWPVSSVLAVAKATIFELQIPRAFADWRDISAYIITTVLGFKVKNPSRPDYTFTLNMHNGLSSLLSAQYHERRIIPLSTIKPHTVTHRKRKNAVHLLKDHDVCLSNALQFELHDKTLGITPKSAPNCTEEVAQKCTYRLPHRSKALERFAYKPPSSQDGLQPNEVIASLSDAPLYLSIDEYKALTSIPLGRQLTYLNIVTQLAIPAVDFTKAESQCFILQATQQAGESNGHIERVTHSILTEATFALAMLQQLVVALERVTENWESWRAVATFSLLAKRVLSLTQSSDVRTQAFEYLSCLRRACMKWILRLKERASSSTEEDQRNELHSRATEIALVCTDTYDVADTEVDTILQQKSAISTLLRCSITIQESHGTAQSDHSGLHKSSLQAWKAMMYRMFPRLQSHIQFDSTGLNDAVLTNWAAFQPASAAHWTSLAKPQEHWLCIKSGTLPVHFNLVTAELLVNGLPLARLPEEFMHHSMYSTLFSTSTLEVVPTDEPGLKFGAKAPHHGYNLHFGMKDNDMLVVSIKNSSRWDLLPPRLFKGRLPDKFVNYVHWYDHSNDIVEFRPQDAPWFSEEDLWRLQHNISTNTWRLVKAAKILVNMTSASARSFSSIFRALEVIEHIHVTFDTVTRVVDLELPRLQLSFFLGPRETQIQSRQYRGMVIDPEQSIGTLVGLDSKLVLKNQSGRVIVIPVPVKFNKTTVQYRRATESQHTRVSISRSAATKVYAYAIDEDLGRIVDTGDIESKLFLSLLHALTSHCLPDILTKLTGAESSLSILRSAAIRSFDVLADAHVELLRLIGLLSASREFYPRHLRVMQQVKWDAALPSLSQHSYFRTAVDSIFDLALETSFFHPNNPVYDLVATAQKAISSNAHLENRETIRTAIFRVSGFGAEDYTTRRDSVYNARDRNPAGSRTSRVHQTVAMMLRHPATLLYAIPDLKKSLLDAHFHHNTISGVDTSYELSRLRYDSKWLGDCSVHLVKHWCSLHQYLPIASRSINQYDISIWLATMSYAETADMSTIQALFAFYRLPDLATVQPPSVPKFELSRGNIWNSNEILAIAKIAFKPFDSSTEANLPKQNSETEQEHDDRIRSTFTNRQMVAIQDFNVSLKQQWPIRRPSAPHSQTVSEYINVGSAMKSVTSKFEAWHDNREFHRYLQDLGDTIARQAWVGVPSPRYILSSPESSIRLSDESRNFGSGDIFAKDPPELLGHTCAIRAPPREPNMLVKECATSEQNPSFREPLEELCHDLEKYAQSKCEKNYVFDLRASCVALDRHSNDKRVQASLIPGFKDLLVSYLQDCESHLNDLNNALLESATQDNIISRAQHSLRVSPQFWISQLHRNRFYILSESWKDMVIAYGLAITNLHRAQRLLALVDKPIELIEELHHVGHSNWILREYPETLLLEAESGIMVRKEQEYIASQMRSAGDYNFVCQLLMGGGKSTTIVPMLSTHFSDKTKLVRVIVAKPQSKQMLQMLISKLGGLLNRRIFHMPFSRNLKMTLANATAIRKLYSECIASQGVLLVLPEQILSFRLMTIECVLTDQTQIAHSLLSTQKFFEDTSRDIIDESDENFSVKFELIYTEGAQQSIEFAPERWLIIQEIIGLVPRYATKVHKDFPDAVDIQGNGDGIFPRIRLLRKDAADQLLGHLATHIVKYGIAGLPCRSQSPDMRKAIRVYITKMELDASEIAAVEKSRFWTDSTKAPLLLVRGLLAGGVLRFVLSTKRWRINYGRDVSRVPATNLAVPYRSKDTPSPRSEFAHSDVVILLTLLSYYYGGLSNEELFDTFAHLLSSDQANIHYDEFVSTASSSLPTAFRQLSGLSIRDRHQCIMEIFPALRHSKNAIDYFLSYLIFPKQLKQFPSKLSNSSWDLGMKKTHPVTGFSGTNDTLHLLPLDVKHLDLPSQSHTNAQVLAYLLQQETSVELLPPRRDLGTNDGEHLLRFVEKLTFDTRVVLDCGASIMEQNNKQVAETWLAMRDSDIQAVVFFQEEELSVLDRTGRMESLQTSPFAKSLEVCIVYLDEAHTRGTDLKLPRDYRAAVTLGSRLTKDQLSQACMRLRKLGHGQSVTFIVPEEISTRIRELTSKSSDEAIQVKDVLCWSVSETWQDLKRSLPLWAVQGNRFENQRDLVNGVGTTKDQAQAFLEPEAQDLESRYKPKTKDDDATNQINGWDLSNSNITQIVSRCRDFEAMGFNSAALSEEQERELAPEIEEERQIERPARMSAEKNTLHSDLQRLVRTGDLVRSSEAYGPAFQTLRSTSAARLFELSGFPSDLLVTKDFARTVKIPHGSTRYVSDSYQRSVQFVLSVPSHSSPGTIQNLIVISPFEANVLLPTIRASKKVTLHLFAPRSNASFESLDRLMLYNIGHIFNPGCVSRSLTMQLNIFAGSLYLRSFSEYSELCDYLGLLRTNARADQQVWADGFIDPPCGLWKLKKSPVPFLRAFLMRIRREGEGVEKTHLGKILSGIRLEEDDFEEH
ncbi:hypothetical protein T440DRAFT_531312 [Plenodomus tracheiphilus IPT5]|uniref:ubiquitinyl hydrolase 1 n=1 Tax=Plenodomus tracheiphilus IPT5 TaxID=1408161 RepID=A0A6A7BL32_9PLEO|nr:hypothetical protein T440DRAFT_531312 [Plenodomus tracheiphilus IPT5]